MRVSAGLMMYRLRDDIVEVLLGHPGGPYFQNKDDGAWTIPKGEPDPDEDLQAAARREFEEETGLLPREPFIDLGRIKQKDGKVVHAWAFADDCDPTALRSNSCTIEWPPKSKRRIQIPELDRVAFFDLDAARSKIRSGQDTFLEELAKALEGRSR